ncbi:zinc ABC transporter ATP-binding protein ZnuC [Pseudemcibacter aquimaris]|uniref:zinc ABC transporter ATP-binding protein ZnuC n=1 Tax=Pseudemcibacter aquimaris TaxID=2857064 RepID=UPI0020119182|nr:zinc ABC transporter ATP-binding protein ZnuC [Pseudemcibacter aquimaris]MCC3860577.1 zinc ABC transporter ATP-binding protein ZnuC [Pseudemcibacter aquimaris]WDU59399.1 zinc ABC transporter ATP-binding protein ZnuC [Pseudemcibacter aquimaris]
MSGNKSPLLKLSNICKSYHKNLVLENVSFSVNRGETVTLIGPNGAGKSTLMKISLGILDASSGEIDRENGISIGYMPQKIMVDDTLPLSVRDFLYLRPKTTYDEVMEALETVRLSRLADQPVQSVSGGEMQRILLARAILGKPDLLVLDEPVQGIDIMGQQEIYGLIAQIRDETGCGVLMISHDLHLVMASTDQVLCLNRHICCSGSPEFVKDNPEYHAMMGRPMEGVAIYTHHHNEGHDERHHGHAHNHEHGEGCNHD